jgi:hypothetical protein
MLGTAVCPEIPRLMQSLLTLIIGKKGKKISFLCLGAFPAFSRTGLSVPAKLRWNSRELEKG